MERAVPLGQSRARAGRAQDDVQGPAGKLLSVGSLTNAGRVSRRASPSVVRVTRRPVYAAGSAVSQSSDGSNSATPRESTTRAANAGPPK
ncbi:hypothetical protein [Streptomyces laurentii]|uniref:hypothetical protein n=1 Tax=Streptomyces laurentii TaxID=39478 RepID=UPI0036A61EE4